MIALVLGAADCLSDDLREAEKLVDPAACLVVACNDAGFLWPGRLDHWATLHPNELWLRERKRRANGYPDGYETWTKVWPEGLKHNERICNHAISGYQGSSGLLSVGVALTVGADRIMLCGIPMDTRYHVVRKRRWAAAEGYRRRWIGLHNTLAPVVRSFSGWTRERFGEPTHEWLEPHMSATPDAAPQSVVLTQHPNTE